MNDASRARSDSPDGWDRARSAYVAVLGDRDPGAAALADGVRDLRLGHSEDLETMLEPALLSGPDDLRELRAVVETAVGVGAWPAPADPGGEVIRARIAIDRPAVVLGLLMAMEGLIERRSPWGRWRTAVDTMAPRVSLLEELTVDLRVRAGSGGGV